MAAQPDKLFLIPAGRKSPGGFTLIELLVVIAVIALLVAMTVPTLVAARLLAKRASCQGSLSAVGKAAMMYQTQYGGFVPVCWSNIDESLPHPWKSWRANLLPYATVAALSCPAGADTGTIGERFYSIADVTGHDLNNTINAGSYGVMYQYSLASYQTMNYSGITAQGHPMWSNEFSTVPGVAWLDPPKSVYVADAYLAKGPIAYPSPVSYKNYGTSAIVPPSAEGYRDEAVTRRFADRHRGTNCLFIDGGVRAYPTAELDAMEAGRADCIWDVE